MVIMKRLRVKFIVWALLLPNLLQADSFEDFGRNLMDFCTTPSQEGFTVIQKQADEFKTRLLDEESDTGLMTAVMFARISEKYGWAINESSQLGSMATEISAGNSDLAKYVADDAQVDSGKLDLWWISYFATGEPCYLDKLLNYAGEELPEGDIGKMLVISAATWSFKSNCEQHESVRAYAQKKSNEPSCANKRAFLQECAGIPVDGGGLRKGSTILDENREISPERISEYIEMAEPFIRQYPPRFKSKEHQEDLLSCTKAVIGEVGGLNISNINDCAVLTDLGYILSMGYNLDLGSGDVVRQYFNKALSIGEDDLKTNYLYGMFLVSTAKYQLDSIPYLEKALQLGKEDARFTLGLLKIQQGKNEEGLQMLEMFSEKNPENDHVKMMIQKVKDNQLKFHSSEDAPIKEKGAE